jgi:hypothetical protein
VPGLRLSIVVVAPVPDTDPGLIVHVPPGKPVSMILPVGTAHDAGCVTAPINGAGGAVGAALITTVTDSEDIQPFSLVT